MKHSICSKVKASVYEYENCIQVNTTNMNEKDLFYSLFKLNHNESNKYFNYLAFEKNY